MARQSFAVSVRSAARPDAVFALLADGAGWSRWAGPLVPWSAWERTGDPPPGGVGAIRRLGTRLVHSREEIVSYDPPRSLSYALLSGQPVRDYQATVALHPDGTGTRIEWSASFEPPIDALGAPMRAYLAAIVRGFARRLADAAAHGTG